VARKKGDTWYLGGMTNWNARTFNIPLTFLDGRKYKIEILKDGVNVDKHAVDYQILNTEISAGETLTMDMAAGGGYVAILTPLK
jgi:alpha-glucosidase